MIASASNLSDVAILQADLPVLIDRRMATNLMRTVPEKHLLVYLGNVQKLRMV